MNAAQIKNEMSNYNRKPEKADPRNVSSGTMLKSSSKYLNHSRLREWVSIEYLRREGPDFDTYEPVLALYEICKELIDPDEVNAMFRDARAKDKALDSWFERGFIADYSGIDSLGSLPEGTLGRIFWEEVIHKRGLAPDFLPDFQPSNDWEFWLRRAQQTHDIHHIVTQCNFDTTAEARILAIYMANWMTHLPRALASQLLAYNFLIAAGLDLRAALHAPESWLELHTTKMEGHELGQRMAPLYLPEWEKMWDRPLVDIQRELNVIQPKRRIDTVAVTGLLKAELA